MPQGKPQVRSIFPTPILVWENAGLPEFNQVLLKIAREKEKAHPADHYGRSNKGGWHSTDDALQWDYPAIEALKKTISVAIREMVNSTKLVEANPAPVYMHGWFNVLRNGAFNRQHEHHPASYSGVYYVQAGDYVDDERWDGAIQFIDPRVGITSAKTPGNPFTHKVRVIPKDGMLLLFPGWLRHVVYPYTGKRDRVCIAFNIEFGPEQKPNAQSS